MEGANKHLTCLFSNKLFLEYGLNKLRMIREIDKFTCSD